MLAIAGEAVLQELVEPLERAPLAGMPELLPGRGAVACRRQKLPVLQAIAARDCRDRSEPRPASASDMASPYRPEVRNMH